MKAKDARKKSKKELEELMQETKNKLFKVYQEKAQSQLKNVRLIALHRKTIARIHTLLNEK
jgi:ribosomal protein L29